MLLYILKAFLSFLSEVFISLGSQLFSQDPAVLEIGTYILFAILISALFNGFTGLFTSIFQAFGQGTPTTIMALAQGVLFFPVIIMLHSVYGLHGLIWSMTITETITCLMGTILFILYGRKIKQLERENSLAAG